MLKVLLAFMLITNVVLANDWVKKGDTVIDKKNHLQWEDNAKTNEVVDIWKMVHSRCSGLHLAGFNDWRLPSKRELQHLAKSQKEKAIFAQLEKGLYWSSDKDDSDAFVVYIPNGFTSKSDTCDKNYAVCVRDTK